MVESILMKSGIKKVDTVCNFCGGSGRKLITTGQEHEYDNTTSDVFNVVKCTDCGLVYLNPRPDVSELSTIYPPNYYSYNQQKLVEEARVDSTLARLRKQGFIAKIDKSLSLAPKREPVTVLDIGCGDGLFLNLFTETQGHLVETHGLDFNAEAAEKAAQSGHKSYAGRFEDVELPENYFDLVIASHVIEHVEDPKGFTEKFTEFYVRAAYSGLRHQILNRSMLRYSANSTGVRIISPVTGFISIQIQSTIWPNLSVLTWP